MYSIYSISSWNSAIGAAEALVDAAASIGLQSCGLRIRCSLWRGAFHGNSHGKICQITIGYPWTIYIYTHISTCIYYSISNEMYISVLHPVSSKFTNDAGIWPAVPQEAFQRGHIGIPQIRHQIPPVGPGEPPRIASIFRKAGGRPSQVMPPLGGLGSWIRNPAGDPPETGLHVELLQWQAEQHDHHWCGQSQTRRLAHGSHGHGVGWHG